MTVVMREGADGRRCTEIDAANTMPQTALMDLCELMAACRQSAILFLVDQGNDEATATRAVDGLVIQLRKAVEGGDVTIVAKDKVQ